MHQRHVLYVLWFILNIFSFTKNENFKCGKYFYLVKTVQMLLMAIKRGQLNLDIFKTDVTVDLNNGW